MSLDSSIDFSRAVADADVPALRALGLYFVEACTKTGEEADALFKNVDIQAIREFRKVSEEAHLARHGKRVML